MRRGASASPLQLARVVEAMQRLKTDGDAIVAEVADYLGKHSSLCYAEYLNEFLRLVAKSLDVPVVDGIVLAMPRLGIAPDSGTFEVRVQMHFATRSFQRVLALAEEMRAKDVQPTRRVSLMLLKTAIQTSQLEEAIAHFRELMQTDSKGAEGSRASDEASAATPPATLAHISARLVELASKLRKTDFFLRELEGGRISLSTGALNAMLGEAMRIGDTRLLARLERLGAKHGIEKDGCTFGLLTRGAGSDEGRLQTILDEMDEASNDGACSPQAVQSILEYSRKTRTFHLVEQLSALLEKDVASTVPSISQVIRFYAEAGQPERACDLYETCSLRLRPGSALSAPRARLLPDCRAERALASAAVACGRDAVLDELLSALADDVSTQINLIRGCALQGDLNGALTIFRRLEDRAEEALPISLWNAALDACVEAGNLPSAEALMERLVATGAADTVSYNTLIKAHLKQKNYTETRAIMSQMAKRGPAPNHVTYNELLLALANDEKSQNRAMVWSTVDEMRAAGIRPNRVTCSILLKALKPTSSHLDIQRSMELTDSMDEPMDEVLLSSVMEACVRVKKVDLLTQRLNKIKANDYKVEVSSAHAFGSLIKACGYARDVEGAWHWWREMRARHAKPTAITIGCMVEAVVGNGDVDGGYELITSLLEDEDCKSLINAIIYGSVLKGYNRSNRPERVFALFDEMVARGIEPAHATFNVVIDACARNGRMERVSGFLADMKARGFSPNLITYSTLIKGYCNRGDLTAALKILEELNSAKDVRPDDIVFNTMLDGCANAGLVTEGEAVFRQMEKQNVPVTAFTLVSLARLKARQCSIEDTLEAVERAMQRHRVKPTNRLYSTLIQACLQGRNVSCAADVFERAVRERVPVESRTVDAVMAALIQAGDFARVRQILRLACSSAAAESARETGLDESFLIRSLGSLRSAGAEGEQIAAELSAELLGSLPARSNGGPRSGGGGSSMHAGGGSGPRPRWPRERR
eukprot:TRINITY_DN11784_c0_g1_i1.p1 TRINITY_DN11784_c0_g1~~TRINITY_DN11784_c0_g1_i1.p1  ORF type:complete len:1141 (-),score=278.76 TRINITY_DN11784_c0_g1_i1:74-3049(-)